MIDKDDISRFEEIMTEISELVSEARGIVRCADSDIIYRRAESYWVPHILGNIGEDYGSEWVGAGSMVNMDKTLEELREECCSQK